MLICKYPKRRYLDNNVVVWVGTGVKYTKWEKKGRGIYIYIYKHQILSTFDMTICVSRSSIVYSAPNNPYFTFPINYKLHVMTRISESIALHLPVPD